jgi:hypothetical protein
VSWGCRRDAVLPDLRRGLYPAPLLPLSCFNCWRLDAGETVGRSSGGYAEGWAAGYAAAKREGARASPPPAVLDGEFIMRLVRLVHPDKHPPARFHEANAATARLLALREERNR